MIILEKKVKIEIFVFLLTVRSGQHAGGPEEEPSRCGQELVPPVLHPHSQPDPGEQVGVRLSSRLPGWGNRAHHPSDEHHPRSVQAGKGQAPHRLHLAPRTGLFDKSVSLE